LFLWMLSKQASDEHRQDDQIDQHPE